MSATVQTLDLDVPDVLREDATLSTPANDDDPMARPWTEDDVLRVLWRHFAGQSWAPVPQVTVALRDLDRRADLGWYERMAYRAGEDADRRIDMLLIRPATKHGIGPLETLAIEVKVTRADFLNDVAHPEKQAPWRQAAHRHAYATPGGLVKRDEVPEASGLLAVKHGWSDSVEWVRRAPYRDGHNPQLPKRVHIALAHRLSHLEAGTRGWSHNPDAAGDDQDVRAALVAAQKAAEKATRAAERAQGKADAWKAAHALATPAGHPCRWCGEPVKPLNPGAGWFKKWRHVNSDHDEPCAETQVQTLENAALDAYEAATEDERRAQLREAQRWGFSDLVEAEPWRAYLSRDYRNPGRVTPTGPEPADVLPEEVEAS